MKDLDLIREQLTKLVNTISDCNFIPYEDRKDITSNAMEQIYKKYLEGRITGEFNEIKGYSFITLRNFCSQFKKRNKVVYTDNTFSHIEDDIIDDDREHKEYLKNIARSHYYNRKMNSELQDIAEHLFDNKNIEDIQELTGLSVYEIGRRKQRIGMILKYSIIKNTKYIIKDSNNPNYKITCKSAQDVKRHFPNETLRNVREKIYNKKQFKDGRYIETVE